MVHFPPEVLALMMQALVVAVASSCFRAAKDVVTVLFGPDLASATFCKLQRSEHDGSCVYLENIVATHSFLCSNLECCLVSLLQWGFELLDGSLGPYWKDAGLTFNCTFLLFGAVIQLICMCQVS
jgi:hypothetical protein